MISFGKIVLAIFVYCMMVALLGVKSLYDSDEQVGGVGVIYFFIHTGGYLYLVHHFYKNKPNKLLLALLMSILIGYIPYDLEYLRLIELIQSPSESMSLLSRKLPIYLGLVVDFLFYPVILFIDFLLLFFVCKKHN